MNNEQKDFEHYQVLGQLMIAEKFTGEKFMLYWKEREEIKNRYGGMPPKHPSEKITVDA